MYCTGRAQPATPTVCRAYIDGRGALNRLDDIEERYFIRRAQQAIPSLDAANGFNETCPDQPLQDLGKVMPGNLHLPGYLTYYGTLPPFLRKIENAADGIISFPGY
jgi:hypothetical protein